MGKNSHRLSVTGQTASPIRSYDLPEAYVATVTGVIVFVGGLTRLALLLELALPAVSPPSPSRELAAPV